MLMILTQTHQSGQIQQHSFTAQHGKLCNVEKALMNKLLFLTEYAHFILQCHGYRKSQATFIVLKVFL